MGETVRKCDVAVVGGAFSGAATAILLRRADPRLDVLILDQKEAFDRKVGESAIELSTWFLTRVLGLDRHLALDQLPKHGLRFWFQNERVRTLAEASELGNRYQARIPGYHINRGILDEHLLGLAREEGAEVLRPARVTEVSLNEGGVSDLRVESPGGGRTIQARWVVDATGRKAWLARKLGLFVPMPEHPTRAVWARYRGTRDFDGDWLPGRADGAGASVSSRGLSTNHFTGPGWWVWVIPLPGGEVSVGVVWDERLFDLPPGDGLSDRFEAFLRSFPIGQELMERAVRLESDLHALNALPFRTRRLMGDGWALVGDAAGFLDPFYSPGLDWASMTASKSSSLIARSLKGEAVGEEIDRHNRDFTRGFSRWFEALYRDKYFYLGDAELMEIALRSEVPLYYIGVVTSPYRDGPAGLQVPFAQAVSLPFYGLMAFTNRRLAKLGKLRLETGSWGRKNAGRRILLPGFKPGPGNLVWVAGAMARLAMVELLSIPDRIAVRRRRAAATARDAEGRVTSA